MNDAAPIERMPRLGEIGLQGFAPYLMNRIMGRYNASLRDEMAALGLTTPKMRALAVLAVIDGLPIRQLAVHAVTEQSTLSRAL
ncbi:MAG: MarR family transcriptional regulator, partial [Gemmobacter sp.]